MRLGSFHLSREWQNGVALVACPPVVVTSDTGWRATSATHQQSTSGCVDKKFIASMGFTHPARLRLIAFMCALLIGPTALAGGPQVPIDMIWPAGGPLEVALRDGKAIATVDFASRRVVRRLSLPCRPRSMARTADGNLVVAGMDGELLAVRSGRVEALLPANGRGPGRVASLPGGPVALVQPWNPELRVVDTTSGRVIRLVPLPLTPGAILARDAHNVLVADEFDGRIASVDTANGSVTLRRLKGVNLHGLALSGDRRELLVAHVTQDRPAPVNSGNIDAGAILSSRLNAIPLAEFDRGTDELLKVRQLTLDGPRHGAADPSSLAVSPDGLLVLIGLSGSHQLLKNDRRFGSPAGQDSRLLPLGHNQRLEVTEVGRNPIAVAIDPTGEFAVTADSMSDSLTVVRLSDMEAVRTIDLGDGPSERTAAQRGEAAFHDGRLALDRWLSCASCHPAGHTVGLNFDTLGDGNYGAPKNTPSLLGTASTAPFAWTGAFETLEGQIHQSLVTSLQGGHASESTASDIAAYLRSLSPPRPLRSADDPSARRGAIVFAEKKCQACHRPPLYTSPIVKDVGLDDGAGNHKAFNPPSLLGVGRTSPYFHDGRARTLDDVLSTHPPATAPALSPADRADLKAFLESL